MSTAAPMPLPGPGAVHVWRAAVGDAPAPADLALLTLDEQARLERLRPAVPRAEFATGRALLRRVVARYLATTPDAFAIEIGEHGKPTLGGDHAASGLTFSVSHSGGLACLAVAAGSAVGIDVEVIRREGQHARLAERFFSSSEIAQLRALDAAEQASGFFRIWTRKEAYLKGRGDGITHGLANFDVVLAPEAAAVAEDRHDPVSATRWSLAEIALGPSHVGTVALEHAGPLTVVLREEQAA